MGPPRKFYTLNVGKEQLKLFLGKREIVSDKINENQNEIKVVNALELLELH